MGSARSQQICRVSTLGALSMLETIRVITGSTRARHLTELHDGEIRMVEPKVALLEAPSTYPSRSSTRDHHFAREGAITLSK